MDSFFVLNGELINRWYRRMSMRCHPDYGGSIPAMQAINDAWDQLLQDVAGSARYFVLQCPDCHARLRVAVQIGGESTHDCPQCECRFTVVWPKLDQGGVVCKKEDDIEPDEPTDQPQVNQWWCGAAIGSALAACGLIVAIVILSRHVSQLRGRLATARINGQMAPKPDPNLGKLAALRRENARLNVRLTEYSTNVQTLRAANADWSRRHTELESELTELQRRLRLHEEQQQSQQLARSRRQQEQLRAERQRRAAEQARIEVRQQLAAIKQRWRLLGVGMTALQVQNALGPPTRVEVLSFAGITIWTYEYDGIVGDGAIQFVNANGRLRGWREPWWSELTKVNL